MWQLLADENFNQNVLRGLLRRIPELDIVCIQDLGMSGTPDDEVLEWAALHERIVLSHDYSTMADYAFDRIDQSLRMLGLILIGARFPIGPAIEEIITMIKCSDPIDWDQKVAYLPL